MLYKTHFWGGLATGFFFVGAVSPEIALASAGVAGIAALLPDLDIPKSEAGRDLPILSWILSKEFGHRGALHSILAATVLTALLMLFIAPGPYGFIVPAFCMGYLSHLVLDSFNPEGVDWLWPIKTRFRIPLVRTGGMLETGLVRPAMFLLTLYAAWPFVLKLFKFGC